MGIVKKRKEDIRTMISDFFVKLKFIYLYLNIFITNKVNLIL